MYESVSVLHNYYVLCIQIMYCPIIGERNGAAKMSIVFKRPKGKKEGVNT